MTFVLETRCFRGIDANGNVAFSLTFDRVPDFTTVDAFNRLATGFQFYIGAGAVPPTNTTRPMSSLIRGVEIPASSNIVIRNDSPTDPDPNSGGWGAVRGRVSYALNGRTITFSVPASVLNVSGPFVYSVDVESYGGQTSSYTGASGGPIQFVALDSIARNVYRDNASFLRVVSQGRTLVSHQILAESTIIFEDEARFTYLVYREGESLPDPDGKTRILAPVPDGKYRFTRTSNNRALVALDFDDGTSGGANASDSGAGLRKVFSYVGAFPLQEGSKDAADVVRLNAGTYTVVCSPAQGDVGGDLLVEIYFLP